MFQAHRLSVLLLILIEIGTLTKYLIVTQVRGAKGPIFEDGPNFDLAFRLFHGSDGVVPLSDRSFRPSEKKVQAEPPKSQFNPLAAKAATISLSSFGFGGAFGFDAFSEKWNNQKRKSKSSKNNPSSQVYITFNLLFKSLLPRHFL